MYKNKISAVYKIMNTATGDCYVGSSNHVMHRWVCHRSPSTWKHYPNNPMYRDFQKYGLDKFRFQILAPVMPEYLKQVEQESIELLNPTYNKYRANGRNIERYKEACRKYRQSEKGKEACRKRNRKYRQTDKGREYNRRQARKDMKKYNNQLCLYNGEEVILVTLASRFHKAGIKHPTVEAKKYLLSK